MSFDFVGRIPSSKSLVNRALIVKSIFPDLSVNFHSQSDDVLKMAKAVEQIIEFEKEKGAAGEISVDCGSGGTVLRFLAFRMAQLNGQIRLNGSLRLFERPQESFKKVLPQLGVSEVSIEDSFLKFNSRGWKPVGDAVHIHFKDSSQFASGLLLSSWNLSQGLGVSLPREMKSYSYFEMTLSLLSQLGLSFSKNLNEVYVEPHQKLKDFTYHAEPDVDCAFAVTAAALLCGSARIAFQPKKSMQPDSQGFQFLDKMGCGIEFKEGHLHVNKVTQMYSGQFNLKDCPDLFPVLSVLCAFADGESRLYGAEHLVLKESNRIKNMITLLRQCGFKVEEKKDGLVVQGKGMNYRSNVFFEFNTDHDHRLAMAAGLLKKMGFPIKILRPQVVDKSFPGFFDILGIEP